MENMTHCTNIIAAADGVQSRLDKVADELFEISYTSYELLHEIELLRMHTSTRQHNAIDKEDESSFLELGKRGQGTCKEFTFQPLSFSTKLLAVENDCSQTLNMFVRLILYDIRAPRGK